MMLVVARKKSAPASLLSRRMPSSPHSGGKALLQRLSIAQGQALPNFGAVKADPVITARAPLETEDVAYALGVRSTPGPDQTGGDRGGVLSRSHRHGVAGNRP